MQALVFLRRSDKRERSAATCHCERSAAICRFPQPGLRPEPGRLALYGYRRGAIQMGRSPETRRSRSDASREGRPPHRHPKCDKRRLCPRLGNNETRQNLIPCFPRNDPARENAPRAFSLLLRQEFVNVNACPLFPDPLFPEIILMQPIAGDRIGADRRPWMP